MTPSLNEYVKVCRGNKYGASSLVKKTKKKLQDNIVNKCVLKDKKKYPADILINWHVANNKIDSDNVFFGVKFILDTLVDLGILPNDNRKYIKNISHTIKTTKNSEPYIKVFIM